ncbi:MAG: hypothetical protein LBC74_12485 [Planctomycetaceae bacterium]|nr:hypothetical protein [Planctomycetaceae bacterium]
MYRLQYWKLKDAGGDLPVLVGSMQKAETLLKWQPKFSLKDSISTAWNGM